MNDPIVARLKELLARAQATEEEDEEWLESGKAEEDFEALKADLDARGMVLRCEESVEGLRADGSHAVVAEVRLVLYCDDQLIKTWGGTLIGQWDIYSSTVTRLYDYMDQGWPEEELSLLGVEGGDLDEFPRRYEDVLSMLGDEAP